MNFETSNRPWWAHATKSIRATPPDLAAVFGFVVLVNAVFWVPGLGEVTLAGASIRALVGIPALLFVPGYVLVAIAFPGRPNRSTESDSQPVTIDAPERLALSFGLSVALLPLLGIALGAVWNLSQSAILTSLTGLLVAGIGIATIRQLRLKPEERFGTAVGRWAGARKRSVLSRRHPRVGATTVLLVIAVAVAVGSVGFAVATPYQSGQSSTFSIVTENETGAQLASDYPSTFTVGEPQSLTVNVANDEERTQAYTVVVTVERVDTGGTETEVAESEEVTRFDGVVAAGQTWTEQHSVAPEMAGDDLRLHYYLYKSPTAPADPAPSTAYHDLYLWIDVEGG